MPKILTLNAKSILASGYKRGEENRRRYDETLEENKKDAKFQRNLSVYNSALNAYNASKTSKDSKNSKYKAKYGVSEGGNYSATNTDGDDKDEYFQSDLDDSSVESSTLKAQKARKSKARL